MHFKNCNNWCICMSVDLTHHVISYSCTGFILAFCLCICNCKQFWPIRHLLILNYSCSMQLLEYIQWLTSITNLMHKLFYSITICTLHYNPRHVSSINMPIFMRTNCIITASGIATLCMYSMPVSSVILYNLSSCRWACWCSKHVEDCNAMYILL
jgi:hypothetical protein